MVNRQKSKIFCWNHKISELIETLSQFWSRKGKPEYLIEYLVFEPKAGNVEQSRPNILELWFQRINSPAVQNAEGKKQASWISGGWGGR